MSKRYNEKRAALALKAIDRELDMAYGREDFEANASKDVRGAAMGEGEDELFEKKLSKAEKKAAAKAAREAKRKKKGLTGKKKKGDDGGADDAGDGASSKKVSPEEARKRIEAVLNDPNATVEQKREAALENLSNEEIVVTYESRKTKMHANARNINVSGVTVTFHGKPLIEETNLVINYGNRYGFIGPNGSGKVGNAEFVCRQILWRRSEVPKCDQRSKNFAIRSPPHDQCPLCFVIFRCFDVLLLQSTVMKAIAARAIPIPENLDIYFLNSEYPARDDITALEAVMESNDEIQQLEAKAEALNDAMADADEDGQAEIQQSLVRAALPKWCSHHEVIATKTPDCFINCRISTTDACGFALFSSLF